MKIDNALLKEALELQKVIKSSQSRLDEIMDAIKVRGPFYTREYLVTISTQQRTSVAGLSAFLEAGIEKDWLLNRNLLKTTEFKIVNSEILFHDADDCCPKDALGECYGPFKTFGEAKKDAIEYHQATLQTARIAIHEIKQIRKNQLRAE